MAWLDSLLTAPMQWLKRHTTQEWAFWWMFVLPLLGLALAIRNIRLRRCDTRHAFHVACLVFGLSLLGWMLVTRAGVTGRMMRDRWTIGIGSALFVAVQAWISYAAVDPYARLTWKRCLIGYARFTTGWPTAIVRDAVVGRSLLIGTAFGLSWTLLLKALDYWTSNGSTSEFVVAHNQMAAAALGDGLCTAGLLCRSASMAIVYALLQVVTLVLLHWLTRGALPGRGAVLRYHAHVVGAVPRGFRVSGLPRLSGDRHSHGHRPGARGVLATAIGLFIGSVLTTVPITLDSTAWHFDISMMVLLFLSLFVVTGLAAALHLGKPVRWLPSDPIHVVGSGDAMPPDA